MVRECTGRDKGRHDAYREHPLRVSEGSLTDHHRPVIVTWNGASGYARGHGAEFVAGAEEAWHRRTGRPMTAEEIQRVLGRYPGDI